MKVQKKFTEDNWGKLEALKNPKLHAFVEDAIQLCQPASVFVCTDAEEDIRYIRDQAIALEEETNLELEGHTVHFDGMEDQGRDKDRTKYLVPKGMDLGANLGALPRDEGLEEIRGYLKGSMKGREMIVRFFCLGPVGSDFAISGVQLTDSAYVAHSEDLLYRPGYEQFKALGEGEGFFRVLHSAGALKNGISSRPDRKRIYIDIQEDLVYSVNTQYAGNTVGFKKLALRLAIRKADREGWLAEHMFIMGAHGPRGRVTYFAGGFPSFCGKTSTAMIPGETIVGDDLAYLKRKGWEMRAVNVESGIFGIIKNVNAKDDPVIWKALTNSGEVIFSNVLVNERVPYWQGDGRVSPEEGVNYSGKWRKGKKDANKEEIPLAHANARYTIRLRDLANLDRRWDDLQGVALGGIIYGGRDSDTWVPVQESFDWTHGVITMAACLESETTAATLGQEGVRSFQPMSNLDFVSIPLGRYVQNHLNFAGALKRVPRIFAVNYFQKDRSGSYLTGMSDKNVWLKWMELRVHGNVDAILTPTGWIPRYQDLHRMFPEVIGKKYIRKQYLDQFTLRIPENLAKLRRIVEIYRTQVPDTPQILFTVLEEQMERLRALQAKKGDYVSPFDLS